jgi:hypothetical protein
LARSPVLVGAELPVLLSFLDAAKTFSYWFIKKLILMSNPPARLPSTAMCTRANPLINAIIVVRKRHMMTPLINGISIMPPPGDMSCVKKDDIFYIIDGWFVSNVLLWIYSKYIRYDIY